MSARYVVNQPVVLDCTFTVSGTATDPTTITLVVTNPAGTATTYTYAATTITKTSTGVYTKTVTADSVGVWSYVWTGAGTAADVQDGTFTVFDDVPLNTNYCTLDELKTEKGMSDVVDDMILQLSISAASRMIDGACSRRFWQDPTAVAREYFPYSAVECETDDISTTSGLIVKADIDLDGVFESTLTINTDYQVHPRNAAVEYPVQPYTTIQIVPVGSQAFFPRPVYGRASVQVTAKYGWPAVPDDIKKACLIQAQQLAKSKDAAFGVAALATVDGAGMRAQAWNPLAWALINRWPYMKARVG